MGVVVIASVTKLLHACLCILSDGGNERDVVMLLRPLRDGERMFN